MDRKRGKNQGKLSEKCESRGVRGQKKCDGRGQRG